jgi:hypothetical protein
MRKLTTISLVLSLVLCLAAAAQTAGKAQVKLKGTIVSADPATKTITCHWKTGDLTFKTTDKTQYWMAGKPGSWADVKPGETVSVAYHDEGADHVAETIRIGTSKAAAK